MTVEEFLHSMKEEEYAAFQRRLIPNIPPETILGVRTPALRQLAKELPDPKGFRQNLPHRYFEENQIHAFSLEKETDFSLAIAGVEAFLPYIDNWATCDQLRPKCFAKKRDQLIPCIRRWLDSPEEYTVRFGLEMLLVHFLDEGFMPLYLEWAADVRREEYYIRMMAAWYFATALAKHWDDAFPYIAHGRLDSWTHNKAIRKAIESRRLTQEQKERLRKLRA